MQNNPLESARTQIDKAAQNLSVDSWIIEKLKTPDRIIKFQIQVKMDNGEIQIFQGFRSQHSNARGPYKGGIRFHHNVTEDEVTALSIWMSIKTAIAGVPYGGGKGGVIVDVTKLSANELERLSRGYVRAAFDLLGGDIDIPAPDVNTDGRIIAWMVDEYNTINRRSDYSAFTGKPIEIGGSQGREEATGQGGVYILEEIRELIKKKPKDITIAVQGFGNVGYWFAQLAYDLGYKIVAVSDSKGAIFNENGINPKEALKIKESSSLSEYEGEIISNEELLELDVDILVPSALESVITKNNAKNIKAKYIIEMANGPVTPEADEILESKGITAVPDVLANSGGVTVSYLEWVQNRQGYYWSKEEINSKLSEVIRRAFRSIYDHKVSKNISFRNAAFAKAINDIAESLKTRF